MEKTLYSLTLEFDTDDHNLLYEGISWYNKNIVDQLEIREDQIILRFTRIEQKNPEDYIYSDNSPARFQFYRAACFYLAVVGKLPDIKKLTLQDEHNEISLKQEILTTNWANCKVDICLSYEIASRVFHQDGKRDYIVLTYFLKAQLDMFSHDAFRAAWSCLNAIYTPMSDSNREGDKLRALREVIRTHKLPEAETYVRKLDNDFWRHLQWYNFSQTKSLENLEKSVMNNQYTDKTLYQMISNYVCGVYRKEDALKAEEIRKFAEERLKKKRVNANEQLRFLVTEYCYMLRNRSFHAGRPYPIFGMKNDKKENEEKALTKLILLTVKDLLCADNVSLING